jgi:DNA polymerase III epsilon subunit-like protein
MFVDVETNGLPIDHEAPVSELDNWPRIVQIAYKISESGNDVLSRSLYIKPDGFDLGESEKVHQLSLSFLMRYGFDLDIVLDMMMSDFQNIDYFCAHNWDFDSKVLGSELIRSGRPNILANVTGHCTMKDTVEFCAIPSKKKEGLKYPRLQELHEKLFGYKFEKSHNAFFDVEATGRCFWELTRLGVL